MNKQIYQMNKQIYQMNNPITYIMDNIYIGNINAAKSREILINNKITAVINLANEEIEYPRGIRQLDISIHDSPEVQISEYFKETYNFINRNNTTGNVLVHCHAGISRSVTIVLYYLMRKYNMKLLDALYTVIDKRKIANPNRGFLMQLIEYEEKKKKRYKG
jgi:protein-tyrosine phosphatase